MRKISSVLVLLIALNTLIAGSVSAKGAENYDGYNIEGQEVKDGKVRTQAAQVIVFVAGIAAGYIVDGVLIRYTGRSGGEWVAQALDFHKKNKKCSNIMVTKKGNTYCHSGSRGSF